MKNLAEIVLRKRTAIIALVLAISILAVLGLKRTRVESDIVKWLDPNDPAVKLFDYIGEHYGGTQLALVAVETDNIFTHQTLSLIRDLTVAFQNMEGVSSVTSLANILDIRKSTEGVEVTKLIDIKEVPTDSAELDELRRYVLSKELYRGKIVSPDGHITLVLARLSEDADKAELARRIRTVTDSIVASYGGNYKIYYSGIPLQMEEVNNIILKDLKRLIPIAALIVVLMLFIGFHSVRGVVLPLSVVLLATLWSIGLMGWTNVPLSIVSNIMPVLLIAIGTAYGIHFLARYREEFQTGKEVSDVIRDALSEVGLPILMAGLTTLAGFLSFIGSYLVPINHFGIFTAFGVGVAMVLSLTMIPAVLSYLRPPKALHAALEFGAKSFSRIAESVSQFVLKHERGIIRSSIAIIIFCIIGLTRITTSVNMAEYFPKDSDIRKAADVMRQNFGGDLPIQLLVKGDLKSPAVLNEVIRLEKYLRTVEGVHNPQSVGDLIVEMNDVMNGRRAVPATSEGVANLMFMLEGEEIMSQLVRDDYQEGVVQARFSEVDTRKILNANDSVQSYLETRLARKIATVRFDPEDDSLLSIVTSRVADEITWDVRFRSGDWNWHLDGLDDTLKVLLKSNFELSEADVDTLADALTSYFLDEADVILSEDVIDKLVQKLVESVRSGELNGDSLKSILAQYIPADQLEEDPELLEYTLESVEAICSERLRSAHVNVWLERIHPMLPEVRDQKELIDELKGDLWTLTLDHVYLPEDLLPSDVEVIEINELDVQHSGLLPIYTKVHRNLLKSQIRSLILAFAIVTLLVALQLKSLLASLVATFPIALVVAFNFGLMGVIGIPLDNATMMIASIAIGIGIDYMIHLVARYRFERQKGMDDFHALERSIQTTGQAILLNAVTVGLGFLVLIFAELVPIQRFGWMVALTMATSAIAALTFLPAAILLWGKLFGNNSPRP